MSTPFDKTNELIDKFMKENDLSPMHLEMYLQIKHDIICTSREENEEIEAELDRLRNT